MKASFVLEHVEIGAFVKVGYDTGATYGTLLAVENGDIALRIPEGEGGTVTVINMEHVESIQQGATARGMFALSSQSHQYTEVVTAIHLAAEQMRVEGEHA